MTPAGLVRLDRQRTATSTNFGLRPPAPGEHSRVALHQTAEQMVHLLAEFYSSVGGRGFRLTSTSNPAARSRRSNVETEGIEAPDS